LAGNSTIASGLSCSVSWTGEEADNSQTARRPQRRRRSQNRPKLKPVSSNANLRKASANEEPFDHHAKGYGVSQIPFLEIDVSRVRKSPCIPTRVRRSHDLFTINLHLPRLKKQELVGKLSQLTKICKSPRLTVMFSGITICVSPSMPIRPYLLLVLIKSDTYLVFVSTLYSQCYHLPGKQAVAQSKSYSCEKLTMRQAERDALDLITKFIQSSNENQKYAPWELFATSHCLYS
jgi:hypothetical protein